ncbi:sulfatase-like hydrolase/transferase [Acidobacteria bacterium AH-259-G07]|nr:sulfatase-like hydrolase/transferase [Acidobacteria bacterium AH-259-G07]
MTDNGTAAGLPRSRQGTQQSGWQGFNDGMRGKKGSEYEGGHRVPFFIRWPAGKIGGGRDVDKLAAHIDVLPTLVDLCGLQGPKGAKLDGVSLSPLLKGQEAWPDRTLFVHSQRIEHPEKWRKSAVMTQRWRLINGKELYDIQLDPGQSRDVAQSNSDVVMMLRAAYERWWDSISSRFDEYVGIAVGSVKENPVRITCHDWHPVGNESVPWNQPAVRRAPEGANGFWVIDVLRDGRYEFIVRQQPTETRFRIQATQARLKIGEQEQEQSIPTGATGVPFVMNLKAGQTRMQSWFTNDEGKSRGAFFIYAQLLP